MVILDLQYHRSCELLWSAYCHFITMRLWDVMSLLVHLWPNHEPTLLPLPTSNFFRRFGHFLRWERTIQLATLLLVLTLIFIILSVYTSVGTPRETLCILLLKTIYNTLSFSIRLQNNKNSMAPMLESWIIQQHPVSTHITSLLFIRYLATLFGYLHFIGCRKNISDTL